MTDLRNTMTEYVKFILVNGYMEKPLYDKYSLEHHEGLSDLFKDIRKEKMRSVFGYYIEELRRTNGYGKGLG